MPYHTQINYAVYKNSQVLQLQRDSPDISKFCSHMPEEKCVWMPKISSSFTLHASEPPQFKLLPLFVQLSYLCTDIGVSPSPYFVS